MADLARVEQAKAEAAAAAMAQMVAADVHQVMMRDLGYADLVHCLAVATIAGLEAELDHHRG